MKNGNTFDKSRLLSRLNKSRHVMWLLFGLSFLETIILPIPIELVLIPFMVANRERLWKTALYVTAGCLAASLVGYGAGYFLFETVGQWMIDTMRWQQSYENFQRLFDQYGFFGILMVGVLPIPFQAAMLTAGAAGYAVWKFALAATMARGIRYFGLALLVHLFGDSAQKMWQRHRIITVLLLAAIITLLWFLVQWLNSAIA